MQYVSRTIKNQKALILLVGILLMILFIGSRSVLAQWKINSPTTDIITTTDGNVGIGVNDPGGNKLAVNGPISLSSRIFPGLLGTEGGYSLVHFKNGTLTTGGIIRASQGNGDAGDAPLAFQASSFNFNGKVTINANGDIDSSGSIAAKWQDIAEWVKANEALEAGTVVVAHPTQTNTVQASYRAYDTTVLGAVSGQPGLLLGEAGEGKVKVSAHGRVRVKVTAENGTIRIGDLLVTSATAGHAMRMGSEHRPGAILGKALEPLASGTGEILVLLTLQ